MKKMKEREMSSLKIYDSKVDLFLDRSYNISKLKIDKN